MEFSIKVQTERTLPLYGKKSELFLGGGGGVKPNWEFSPNFPAFFSDASPRTKNTAKRNMSSAVWASSMCKMF